MKNILLITIALFSIIVNAEYLYKHKNINLENYINKTKSTPQDWVKFFNENCGTNIASAESLSSLGGIIINCDHKGLTNNDLPNGGLNYIDARLMFNNNNFENLNNFKDLTYARTLNFQNNKELSDISALNGFSGANDYSFYNTQVTDFSALSSSDYISYFFAGNSLGAIIDLSTLPNAPYGQLFIWGSTLTNLDNFPALKVLKLDLRTTSLTSVSGAFNAEITNFYAYSNDNIVSKMPADSWTCLNGSVTGGITLSQICEPTLNQVSVNITPSSNGDVYGYSTNYYGTTTYNGSSPSMNLNYTGTYIYNASSNPNYTLYVRFDNYGFSDDYIQEIKVGNTIYTYPADFISRQEFNGYTHWRFKSRAKGDDLFNAYTNLNSFNIILTLK